MTDVERWMMPLACRLVVVCAVLVVSSARSDFTPAPVVGILMQKVGSYQPEVSDRDYIDSDYVKFIESAGGMVVPIYTNFTDSDLLDVFNSVNGVLFPGGDVPLIVSSYYRTAEKIYKLAVAANKKGDHFPLWGTCLGFETLAALRVGSDDVMSHSDADDLSLPLNFTADAKASRLFSKASPDLMRAMTTQAVTYNYHQNCVSSDEFQLRERLKDFFTVLSTNVDRKGKEFISSMEAIDYPFYAVQWHPEINAFGTLRVSHIPRAEDAVAVTQAMANVFISETRKSAHKFASRSLLLRSLINYQCPRMFATDTLYRELYVF